MRLNRTDLVPVLAIAVGGVIGASLSFSFLGSRSDDVALLVAVPVVAHVPSVPPVVPVPPPAIAPVARVVRMVPVPPVPHFPSVGEPPFESMRRRDLEVGLSVIESRLREDLQEERGPRPRS